jgi:hypothetical protein
MANLPMHASNVRSVLTQTILCLLTLTCLTELHAADKIITVVLTDNHGGGITGATVTFGQGSPQQGTVYRADDLGNGEYRVLLPLSAATSSFIIRVSASGYQDYQTSYYQGRGTRLTFQLLPPVGSNPRASGAGGGGGVAGSSQAGASELEIDDDIVSVGLGDEHDESITLYIPASLNNDQCQRRLFGTPSPVMGLFGTLYQQDRRIESYEYALRNMLLQPELPPAGIGDLAKSLRSANVAESDISLVEEIIEKGAEGINKHYVEGLTVTADVKDKLSTIGRKLNEIKESKGFATLCVGLADIEGTLSVGEVVVGAWMLNALANDRALQRIGELKQILQAERSTPIGSDKAWQLALDQAETNVLAAQSQMGAFAVTVNDRKREIVESAVTLSEALSEQAFKVNPVLCHWFWALKTEYEVLKDISNQWQMAQDASSIATLTKLLQKSKVQQVDSAEKEEMVLYGELAFYARMVEVFNVSSAKFRDFISLTRTNKDLRKYYGDKEESLRKELEQLLSSRTNLVVTPYNNFDFKNAVYRIWDESCQFANGVHEYYLSNGSLSGSLEFVSAIPISNDQFAVAFEGNPGGAADHTDKYLLVVSVAHGTIETLAQLGGGYVFGFEVFGDRVIEKEPRYTESDALCCPSFTITTSYRWTGQSFVIESSNERPNPPR